MINNSQSFTKGCEALELSVVLLRNTSLCYYVTQLCAQHWQVPTALLLRSYSIGEKIDFYKLLIMKFLFLKFIFFAITPDTPKSSVKHKTIQFMLQFTPS
jgi:hypothetical protein